DTTRVMGRVKALYRSQAIACAGKKPYSRRHRPEWLSKLNEAGLHRRAERLYEELDALQGLRRAAKRELVLESRKHAAAKLVRTKKPVFIRGLNRNHNHDLKNLFKSAATTASALHGPFHEFYEGLLAKGMQPAMARLTLARKIAAITLSVWKKGESFDAEQL